MDEHSAKFERLARFAPQLVLKEAARAKRLKDGLCPRIKHKFLTKRINTTKEVIDRAMVAEDH